MREHVTGVNTLSLNVAFIICGLLLCVMLISLIWIRKMKLNRLNLFYLGILGWSFLMMIGTLLELLGNGAMGKIGVFLMFFSNAGGFYFYIGYLICYLDEHSGKKASKIVYRVAGIFPTYLAGCTILSLWTGWLYESSEEGVYSRGPYFLMIVLPCFVEFFIVFLRFLFEFPKFGQMERAVFSVYMLVPISGLIIQMIFPNIYIFAPDMTYVMLLIYLAFQTTWEKEMKHSNEAKDIFLANMSHEIRTPINSVIGMNEMILRETKDVQIKEYAQNVRQASGALLGTINDILDISKIDSGQMKLVPVEYKLADLLYTINSTYRKKIEEKKIEFVLDIDGQLPSVLFGDEVRVGQVLSNIVSNAWKYTQKGAITLRISGTTKEDNVYLNFEVIDTGVGIRKEDMNRLLSRFERVDASKNRNIEGAGLGISIVVELLKMMGSNLEVKSKVGEGSIFFFTIEQKIVDATPIGSVAEHLTRPRKEGDRRYIAPDAKILVVDDNMANCKVISALLKRSKVMVTTLTSGRACLEEIQKASYDLIFLDHMMPEMDGMETLQCMKGLEKHLCKETPIIMLTANDAEHAGESYLEMGFDAYLAKPIKPKELDKVLFAYIPAEKRIEVEDTKLDTVVVQDKEVVKKDCLALYPFFDKNAKEAQAKQELYEVCQRMKQEYDVLDASRSRDMKVYLNSVENIQKEARSIGARDIVYWCNTLLHARKQQDNTQMPVLHKILGNMITSSMNELQS